MSIDAIEVTRSSDTEIVATRNVLAGTLIAAALIWWLN